MDWSDFSGRKVGLLGAGVENLALAPHLKKAGAILTICNEADDLRLDEWRDDQETEVVIGSDYLNSLDRFDIVFRIPGMPVQLLKEKLVGLTKSPIVSSAINLFLEMSPCPVIGVTGTKGKGTTSTMIAELLKQTGKKIFVGANINNAVFGFFDQLDNNCLVVLELSSFQLEDIDHSPDIAVLLPITPDHLRPLSTQNPNYHVTMEKYALAKANITAFQQDDDLLIYAADSLLCQEIAQRSLAKKISVGTSGQVDITISSTGQLEMNGKKWLTLEDAGLHGDHIFLDAGLAVAVGRHFGLTDEQVMAGLKNFRPLPHRLEEVATVNGVTYIDDSYATTPQATIAALTAFSQPIILIAGGSSKGADFAQLATAVSRSTVKSVLLLGQEASQIEAALKANAPAIAFEIGESIEHVVSRANSLASSGDIVLLSPACASKDMFANAADRGERFQKAVHAQPV